MSEELKTKLDAELLSEIEHMSRLTPGCDDHKMAAESIAKLYSLKLQGERDWGEVNVKYDTHAEDVRIREKELELREAELRNKRAELEIKSREAELREKEAELREREISNDAKLKAKEIELNDKNSRKDALLKVVDGAVKLIGIVVPTVTYTVWMKRTMLFEETGSFTSTAAKNTLPKVLRGTK